MSSTYISSEARIFFARLFTRGEPLLLLANRKVANDLGELEDIAGLDLLAVVLEAPVPVLGHLADVVAEDRQHLLDVVLPDHAPQPRLVGVAARDHHRHVVVKDLDRQVLALLAEHLLHLLLEDLSSPMMRVDDLVADLVDRRLAVYFDLQILDVELRLHHCVANGVPSYAVWATGSAARLIRFASSGPRG
jgi:hypothetical protein